MLFILLDRYFLLRTRYIDLSIPKSLMNSPNDQISGKSPVARVLDPGQNLQFHRPITKIPIPHPRLRFMKNKGVILQRIEKDILNLKQIAVVGDSYATLDAILWNKAALVQDLSADHHRIGNEYMNIVPSAYSGAADTDVYNLTAFPAG